MLAYYIPKFKIIVDMYWRVDVRSKFVLDSTKQLYYHSEDNSQSCETT